MNAGEKDLVLGINELLLDKLKIFKINLNDYVVC